MLASGTAVGLVVCRVKLNVVELARRVAVVVEEPLRIGAPEVVDDNDVDVEPVELVRLVD